MTTTLPTPPATDSAASGRGIDLRGVVKRYGSHLALRGLDLEIRDGEFFCLLGPSGCGKTTTLNLIGGFVAPSEGEIWIYVGSRITGFMSHWNTYSAEEMFALIMLGSYLLFGAEFRKRVWIWLAAAVLIALAILLGETRGIWIAVAVAGAYLVWAWRPKLVAAVPVIIVVAYFASPEALKDRFTSIFKPKGVDSNEFRKITWRTGLEMISRHPFLGVGPEGVKLHFEEYVPADIPRPLPSGWYGHLHNIYLQYAAERGILTMLAMLWLLLQVLYDFWRGLRQLPPGRSDRRYLLTGGIAVVLATMAEGIVEHNLGDSEVLTMFLVVVASGYLALDREVVDV